MKKNIKTAAAIRSSNQKIISTLISIMMILAVAFSLTACSGKDHDEPDAPSEETEQSEEIEQSTTTEPTDNTGDSSSTNTTSSDIRPEIKEAIDSYEAFFNEYAEFMKTYSSTDDPTALLSEYSSYMSQYTDTMSKLEALEADLNDAELQYYLEATNRINTKLLEVSTTM